MDTSETYIKMCEKAEEIQELRTPRNYDDTMSFWYEGTPNVWLPRQDQLQEMVGEKSEVMLLEYILCFVFDTKKHWWRTEYTKQFDSMEQLWLAFVMKEKYNKIWIGDEWTSG